MKIWLGMAALVISGMAQLGCAITSSYGADKQARFSERRAANFIFKINTLSNNEKLRMCFSEDEKSAFRTAFLEAGFINDPNSSETLEVEITDVTEPNYMGPLNGVVSFFTLTIIPLFGSKSFEAIVSYKTDSNIIESTRGIYGYATVVGVLFIPKIFSQSMNSDLREHRAKAAAGIASKIKLNANSVSSTSNNRGAVGFDANFDSCVGRGDQFLNGI